MAGIVPEEEHLVGRGWALVVRNLTGSLQVQVGMTARPFDEPALEEDIPVSDGGVAVTLGEGCHQTG